MSIVQIRYVFSEEHLYITTLFNYKNDNMNFNYTYSNLMLKILFTSYSLLHLIHITLLLKLKDLLFFVTVCICFNMCMH